jgi:hypothetical protein
MLEETFNALFERSHGRRAARASALHCKVDNPLAKAAIDDVPAVIGNSWAHAGFDQFPDLRDCPPSAPMAQI